MNGPQVGDLGARYDVPIGVITQQFVQAPGLLAVLEADGHVGKRRQRGQPVNVAWQVRKAAGTAAMSSDASSISVGGNFFVDATPSQFEGFIDPADLEAVHSAYATYGSYGTDNSCSLQLVDCDLEP